ncbi:MAG: acriflavin resistance protein [Bryobacterales bacterium]|nr:acriflavin resistance protein [Bryobacterales bacterium]
MKNRSLILPLVLAASALAQTPAQETPARIGIFGEATLTVNEVIERVLAADTDLVISRIAKEEAALNLRGARGVFDPRLGFTGRQTRAISPASSSLAGAPNGKLTNKELLADPSLSGASPWLGTTYRLNFSSARQETDNSFATLNPQYLTTVGLSLTQPLVRGLFYDDSRHRIQVARTNVDLTDQQFRQRLIETVTRAVQAWWELDFAFRNLEVQKEAVRLAERQDASNRRQVEQGLLAPVDIVQTQTLLATYQQNVYAAQSNLSTAENNLKILMLPARNDLMWGTALIPERTADSGSAAPTLDEALKLALAGRPEIRQNSIASDLNKLDTRLAREQAKPQVDLFANVSANGLSGNQIIQTGPNPFSAAFGPIIGQINQLSALNGLPPLGGISFGSGGVPPIFVGGYGQSLGALRTGSFTTAVAGINFSLPLRNRAARAQVEIAAAEQRRLGTQQRQVEMFVEQDVRNALQLSASNAARLEAARTARGYAQQQYESEQRQFQAGTSSVFLVLQRQTELTTARTREVRAEADSGEAAANLDRALARTLTTRNIAVK